MKIFFVTSNRNKFNEAKDIIGRNLEMASLEIEEIQNLDTAEVVKFKLEEAYRVLKKPVCVDDTGLYLDAINGLPGAFAKHFYGTLGTEGLSRLVSLYGIYSATAATSIGFSDGKYTRIFTSKVKGKISSLPKGKAGFGFDSLFIPHGQEFTLSQMDISTKNKFSARGKAFGRLKHYLASKRMI